MSSLKQLRGWWVNMSNCPVCNSLTNTPTERDYGDKKIYACVRCGNYEISRSAVSTLSSKDNQQKSIISYIIRKAFHNRQELITTHHIQEMLASGILPTPQEQADLLILFLGNNQPSVGVGYHIAHPSKYAVMATIGIPIGDTEQNDLQFIYTGLEKEGYLLNSLHTYLTLTFKGWRRFEELKRSTTNSRRAFMAMQFVREGQDNYLQEILVPNFFVPAVREAGFELSNPLSTDPKAGNLHARIEVEIRSSRFIIADLSHGNNGAYWEAGFARGLGKPVIYTCERSCKKEIHFDTNPDYTVFWDRDNLQAAADELKAVVRATLFAEAKHEA